MVLSPQNQYHTLTLLGVVLARKPAWQNSIEGEVWNVDYVRLGYSCLAVMLAKEGSICGRHGPVDYFVSTCLTNSGIFEL